MSVLEFEFSERKINLNHDQINQILRELAPFSQARSGELFELATVLRPIASMSWPESTRALATQLCDELARRSSGHLKALGLLADLGDARKMAEILLTRDCLTAADSRCAAAFFRLLNRPRSQAWAHALAEAAGSDKVFLDTATAADLKARIRGGADVEHDFEPSWAAPVRRDLVWPATPIEILNLSAVRVRPLNSRGQIDRATHYLRNCLSTLYRDSIMTGSKRVATVEVDGTPVEVFEIDRRTGRVLQWKAAQNAAPDAARRRVIESQLVASNIVAGRPI